MVVLVRGNRIGDYSLVSVLYQNKCKKIYKAVDTKNNFVAIKRICKRHDLFYESEIEAAIKLRSKYIVCFQSFFKGKSFVYIVMEFCEGGTLADLLTKQLKWSNSALILLLRQLMLAMIEIGSKGFVHRDIKPQNILFKKEVSQENIDKLDFIIKLSDFGFCCKVDDVERKGDVCGTPLYMAPEVLLKQKNNENVDFWSIGIIFYRLLYGVHPYKSDNPQALLFQIQNFTPLFSKNGNFKDWNIFLKSLLQQNPKKRFSLKAFSFFQNRIKHPSYLKMKNDLTLFINNNFVCLSEDERKQIWLMFFCLEMSLFFKAFSINIHPNHSKNNKNTFSLDVSFLQTKDSFVHKLNELFCYSSCSRLCKKKLKVYLLYYVSFLRKYAVFAELMKMKELSLELYQQARSILSLTSCSFLII